MRPARRSCKCRTTSFQQSANSSRSTASKSGVASPGGRRGSSPIELVMKFVLRILSDHEDCTYSLPVVSAALADSLGNGCGAGLAVGSLKPDSKQQVGGENLTAHFLPAVA